MQLPEMPNITSTQATEWQLQLGKPVTIAYLNYLINEQAEKWHIVAYPFNKICP